MGIACMEDRYFQTNIIDFSETKHDESTYSIFGGSIVLEGSTLNARQFATQGSREKWLHKFSPAQNISDPVYPK